MSEEEILQNNQEIVPFRCEIILDENEQGRYTYELNDGTKIFIKDINEMPSIKLNGNSFVITPEEKPNNIKSEEYDAWVRTNTSSELEGSENIIVNNTPLGSIDLAMTLMKKGEISKDYAQAITELRSKIIEDKVDQQVLDFYDSYMAAGFSFKNKYYKQYSHDGLILLALSLGGDETAITELKDRATNLENYNKDQDRELEPGTKLTNEQLEKIAEGHLVAVHTSYTDVEENKLTLQSTSAHRKDSIRSTLHFSLNHAVISHMAGDFGGRDTTVVSKLESLARDNGSPAVMSGVDTYFTMNPNEELKLSEDLNESVIISFKQLGKNASAFSYEGNIMLLNKDKLEGDDLRSILDEISRDNFNARSVLSYLISSKTQFHAKSDKSGSDSPLQRLVKEMVKNKNIDAYQASNELTESILDGSIKFEDYPSYIYEDSRWNSSYRIESLGEEIQDLVRKLIVDSTITKFGGKLVTSDGMSAYIETPGFDNSVYEIADELGVRKGLHTYQIESKLEDSKTYTDAIRSNNKARRHLARIGINVEKEPKKIEINEDGPGW